MNKIVISGEASTYGSHPSRRSHKFSAMPKTMTMFSTGSQRHSGVENDGKVELICAAVELTVTTVRNSRIVYQFAILRTTSATTSMRRYTRTNRGRHPKLKIAMLRQREIQKI